MNFTPRVKCLISTPLRIQSYVPAALKLQLHDNKLTLPSREPMGTTLGNPNLQIGSSSRLRRQTPKLRFEYTTVTIQPWSGL